MADEVLGGRTWQLRQNLTSYDAAYVALAETLTATSSRWIGASHEALRSSAPWPAPSNRYSTQPAATHHQGTGPWAEK